jgi:hypothetical protein
MRREIARRLLASRDGVTRPPTDQEITSAARRDLPTTCVRLAAGRFACTTRIEGFGAYRCTLRLAGRRATDLRCGAGGAGPPVVSEGLVTCERFDQVLRISDPSGDSRPVGRPRAT